ncbi:hypothetical protein V8C34DRAFT_141432 [Trichoderma compactum]
MPRPSNKPPYLLVRTPSTYILRALVRSTSNQLFALQQRLTSLQYQLRPTWPRVWRNKRVGDNRLPLVRNATNARLANCIPCYAASRDPAAAL